MLSVSLTAAFGVSLFLFLLNLATLFFQAHWNYAVLLLPLVGLFIFWAQKLEVFLAFDLAAPLALCSHLFGAAVGRESAAVQIGVSVAQSFSKFFKAPDPNLILRMGMAAGFAAAFGTPWAGAVFALEHAGPNIKMGIAERALWMGLSAFISFAASSQMLSLIGMQHFHWPSVQFSWLAISPLQLLSLSAAIALFAIVYEFSLLRLQGLARKIPGGASLFVGGIVIAVLTFKVGTSQFNGLGTQLTTLSLQQEGTWEFVFYKTVFLLISVGSGFKGGEVTPLIAVATLFADAFTSSFVLVAASASCLFAYRLRSPLAGIVILVEFFNWKIALVGAVPILMTWLLHKFLLSTSSTLKRYF
jgi:H+/Cl- antiporter ClcA